MKITLKGKILLAIGFGISGLLIGQHDHNRAGDQDPFKKEAKLLMGFDEKKAIEEAKAKGIPKGDIHGYILARKADYLSQFQINEFGTPNYVAKKEFVDDKTKTHTTVISLNNVDQKAMSIYCQNLGMENNPPNYTGWTGDVANNCNWGPQFPVATWNGTGINGNNGTVVQSNLNPAAGASTQRHVIHNQPYVSVNPNYAYTNSATPHTSNFDPVCRNPAAVNYTNPNHTQPANSYDLPYVPYNGAASLRLGAAYASYTCEKAVYAMTVDSNNALLSYDYAVVLYDGLHSTGEQPAFTLQIKDSAGNVLGGNCGIYQVDASQASGDPTFIKSNSPSAPSTIYTYYRKWRTSSVDLSQYIGSTVFLEFQTLDCIYSGHWCYAYVSARCNNLSVTVNGYCAGNPNTATITAPPGYAQYQWYDPQGNPIPANCTGTSQTLNVGTWVSTCGGVSPNPNDTFLVQMTASNGCMTAMNAIFVPNDIVVTNVTGTPACIGGNNGAAVVNASGGTPPYTYTWYLGSVGGTVVGGNSSTLSGVPPGNYYVVVSDNTCQPDTGMVQITAPPVPLGTDTAYYCTGASNLVLNPGYASGGNGYQWYNNSSLISGATSQSYTVATPVNNAVYNLGFSTSQGCKDSVRVVLKQVPGPTFAVTTDPSCPGGATGGINITAGSSSFAPYTFTITPAITGSVTTGGPTQYNIANIPSGVYTIAYTLGTPGACSSTGSITQSYTVNATGIPQTVATTKYCRDNTGFVITSQTGSTHLWHFNGSPASGVNNQQNYTLPPNGAGIYIDTLQDAAGCKRTHKVTVTYDTIKPKYTVVNLKCNNDSNASITVTPTPGPLPAASGYTQNWTGPNAYSYSTNNPTPVSIKRQNLKPGTYNITIIADGCTTSVAVNINNPPPRPDTTFLAYYCPKDTDACIIAPTGVYYQPSGTPKFTTYQWYLNGNPVSVSAGGTNDTLCGVLTSNLTPVNKYYVMFKNDGCRQKANVALQVTPWDAFLPEETVNVFTPDNDGSGPGGKPVNEIFYPFYESDFYSTSNPQLAQKMIDAQSENYELTIYDRWGKKVFESTVYSKGWDGKTKSGKDADEGTYFWVTKYKSNCSTKGDIVTKSGFVQLIRSVK